MTTPHKRKASSAAAAAAATALATPAAGNTDAATGKPTADDPFATAPATGSSTPKRVGPAGGGSDEDVLDGNTSPKRKGGVDGGGSSGTTPATPTSANKKQKQAADITSPATDAATSPAAADTDLSDAELERLLAVEREKDVVLTKEREERESAARARDAKAAKLRELAALRAKNSAAAAVAKDYKHTQDSAPAVPKQGSAASSGGAKIVKKADTNTVRATTLPRATPAPNLPLVWPNHHTPATSCQGGHPLDGYVDDLLTSAEDHKALNTSLNSSTATTASDDSDVGGIGADDTSSKEFAASVRAMSDVGPKDPAGMLTNVKGWIARYGRRDFDSESGFNDWHARAEAVTVMHDSKVFRQHYVALYVTLIENGLTREGQSAKTAKDRKNAAIVCRVKLHQQLGIRLSVTEMIEMKKQYAALSRASADDDNPNRRKGKPHHKASGGGDGGGNRHYTKPHSATAAAASDDGDGMVTVSLPRSVLKSLGAAGGGGGASKPFRGGRGRGRGRGRGSGDKQAV